MLIGFVFRSARAGFYSILPNLLPIAVAGAVLYLTGVGLQFTTVVAFTIGFGIAVVPITSVALSALPARHSKSTRN